MKKQLLFLILSLIPLFFSAQQKHPHRFRTGIPLDSIRLSDPCILADKSTSTYYMTGTPKSGLPSSTNTAASTTTSPPSPTTPLRLTP